MAIKRVSREATWGENMNEKIMRVVIKKEGDLFVAQCLEHDICSQGNTIDELMERLVGTVRLECEERDGDLDDIEPAPDLYHEIWDNARQLSDSDSGYSLRLAA